MITLNFRMSSVVFIIDYAYNVVIEHNDQKQSGGKGLRLTVSGNSPSLREVKAGT